ncbi:MAG: hypothetical protein J0M09_18625 [Xanthomonadales bacterium]|nr:hypothetical protein [Xanthomonadales bacterium]
MKLKELLLITLSLLAIGCSKASLAGDTRLVGVWELSRFDNLHPIDAPEPDGVPNMLYIFYNKRELIYFYPGGAKKLPDTRKNLPFKERIPYELDGNKFHGFLGLTNDLSGAAEVSFPADDEFEVHYPDGSVAVLTRVSKDPASFKAPRLHCVPLTVRGFNYDPNQVATVRQETRNAARNEAFENSILGGWQSYSDDPNRIIVRIDFEPKNRIRNTIMDSGQPDQEPFVFEGSFSVKGSYLVSDRQCFSPEKIWFEGDELRLSPDPGFVIQFKRVNDSK